MLELTRERDLIRNDAAEAQARLDAEEKQRTRLARRSSKDILVDGMMDGSYLRYLKGE